MVVVVVVVVVVVGTGVVVVGAKVVVVVAGKVPAPKSYLSRIAFNKSSSIVGLAEAQCATQASTEARVKNLKSLKQVTPCLLQ